MECLTLNSPPVMSHDQKTKELKPMPCGAFKRQIFKMYPKTPESDIRASILYCQKEVFPHKSEKELKNKQWLSQPVLKELIRYEGVPDGYQNTLKD